MPPLLLATLVRLGSGDREHHAFATVSLIPKKSEASTGGDAALIFLTTYNIPSGVSVSPMDLEEALVLDSDGAPTRATIHVLFKFKFRMSGVWFQKLTPSHY